jgi:hypothetical protein
MPHNEVELVQVIPTTNMIFATGTWSDTASSGITYKGKTTANTTSVVSVLITPPRLDDQFGTKLEEIVFNYRAATQALDAAPTCTLYRVALDTVAGASDDIDATALTITHDGVATVDSNDRKLTVTISDPAYDYSTESRCYYQLDVTLNAGTSTALRVYAAEAKFITQV